MYKVDEFISEFQDYDLELHGVRLPKFKIEQRYIDKLGFEPKSNAAFLRALCLEGFKKLDLEHGSDLYNKYVERVKMELETMDRLGFTDYMLLVWDVINFCHEKNIPTGAGRGSAAGSLVLFLIGVTKIDPVKYELYFERFISETRAKKKIVDGVTYLDGSLMCDIDLDIDFFRRGEVIEYLEEKFKGKTSHILTVSTLSGRILMKECGKIVGGISDGEMNNVTSMIPSLHGRILDITETRSGVKDDKGEWKQKPVEEFSKWCDENPEVYEVALKLRDLVKSKGVHASAMALSYDEMMDTNPVEFTKDKQIISSYTMDDISIFNVKLDLLGLKTLSIVDRCCQIVGVERDAIDINDPEIYQNLFDLKHPYGIFQIGADTGFRVCKQVKPQNLEHLSAVLAIARPGALQFAKDYAMFTNTGESDPAHQFFEDILGYTGGTVLYQEQLMKMANKIGFTLDEAEILRRIVGKKKKKEVAEWKGKIFGKVKEKELEEEVAEVLWKVLNDSADYSFNKSHSISYASLAAVTAYLKFKHPKEFFLACLEMAQKEGSIEKVATINRETPNFGINILPPHILKSEAEFTIEGDNIRYGLSAIKGVSDKSVSRLSGFVEKLSTFKHKHSNKFEVFEGAKESGININVLCALIQAGALEDDIKQTRTMVVLEAQVWNILTDRERKLMLKLGPNYSFRLTDILRDIKAGNVKDDKGKPVIKDSRYETIKKKYDPYKKIYLQNSENEQFANWFYETSLLGYASCITLKEIFEEKRPGLQSIRAIRELMEDCDRDTDEVVFIAVVDDYFTGTARNSKAKYAKYFLHDETDAIPVMIMGNRPDAKKPRWKEPKVDRLEKCREINGGLPKSESIVIVKGNLGDDIVFANVISRQDTIIYTKFADMVKKEAEKKKDLTEKEEVDKKDKQ